MDPDDELCQGDPVRAAFLAAPVPAVLITRVGLVEASNRAFQELAAKTMAPTASIVGMAHPLDRARLARALDDVTEHPVEALPVRFGDDEALFEGEVYARTSGTELVCLQIVDLTGRRERVLELERLAYVDELTGLLNRRGFRVEAGHLLSLASRDRRPVSLLFADVVGLKQVNDTAGHQAGDRVLRRVAATLRAGFRDGDVIGRLGGDEFAVVALTSSEDSADALRHRFSALVTADNQATDDGPDVEVTVGVVSCPGSEEHAIDALLDAGDRAMYRTRARERD